MVGKAAVIFFMSMLFSSSEGPPDSCRSTDFANEMERLKLVKVLHCIDDVVEEYEPLQLLIGPTIQQLQERISVNPEKVSGSIFTLAHIVLAYQQSRRANELLIEAMIEHDDLEIIVNASVVPVLEIMSHTIAGRDEDNWLCKKKDRLDKVTRETLKDLRRSRGKIGNRLMKSTLDELSNNYTVVGIFVGIIGASIMLPEIFSRKTVAKLAAFYLVTGGMSAYMGYGNIQVHHKTQEILASSKEYVKDAEKNLEYALTNINIVCG